MALIRPRLTDYYGISLAQAELDFAIPFLNEDIPLYVDPFLLWKSPSQQDQALHTALVNSFNHQNWLIQKGREEEAARNLIIASECDEVGLGVSAKRQGKRIGPGTANDILNLFRHIPEYGRFGFTHFEEIQLYVDGISKDRISDFTCNFLKSFLIDYTIQQCMDLGIPMRRVKLESLYNYRQNAFQSGVEVELPVHPDRGTPLLLVPKRWLRHVPWISFDEYFATYCPADRAGPRGCGQYPDRHPERRSRLRHCRRAPAGPRGAGSGGDRRHATAGRLPGPVAAAALAGGRVRAVRGRSCRGGCQPRGAARTCLGEHQRGRLGRGRARVTRAPAARRKYA
jgi:hypothetical protein